MTVKQKKTRTVSRKNRVERKRLAVVFVSNLIDPTLSKAEAAKVLARFKALAAEGRRQAKG